jgi:trimeric autotransporter adhesin
LTTIHPQSSVAVRPLRVWGGLAALAASFLFGSSAAFAAPAPANTVIGNQASASYQDANGNAQVTTSNLVQTTVQQVGAFTLDAKATTNSPLDVVNNKSGAAGAVIYAPHVLVNTGNGADAFTLKVDGSTKFTKVEIYNDTNFDGLPDSATPLCTGTSSGCTVATAQTVAGNNGQFGFVVAYTISSTATGTGAYDLGKVTVAPQAASTSMYVSTNQSVAVQDSVTLTDKAAFNVSKAIMLPSSGINPASGSWPAATNNGKRTPSSASCPTTWSGVAGASASCVYTTYTVTYSNTGGGSGRFSMQDVIGSGATAGFTYVTGSAIWSNASGTALSETAGNAGNAALGAAGVDLAYDSGTKTLTFVDNTLPVNVTRSLTFVVLVNNTATVGTGSTTNTVKYNAGDATSATAAVPVLGSTPANSNGAPFTVLGSYSIVLGTASSAAAADAKDSTAGTPLTGATDTQTLASAAAGKPAVFTHKVYNQGNDTDSVNIALSANTFPAGTVVRYYKSDGTTELSDTNNDGKVDTGPIAAGASVQIVVKAFIPVTTKANASANYSLTVLGTSGSDATQTDASADKLVAVTGPFVDLTNTASGKGDGSTSDDTGVGPNTAPTVSNANVPAGSWTAFSLFVKNNDSVANTYALSASGTTVFPGTLPAGWVVKFATGAVADTACSAATAITSTASVSAAGQSQVTACVYVPATQTAVTQAVYFQVKANSAASDASTPVDTIYDEVKVVAAALTYSATITPNSTGQLAAGGDVVYAHTLTATGTGSCKPATLSVTLPAADVTAGWTYAVYKDVNGDGQLDANDTLITDATLPAPTPNNPVKFLVKIFAPGGAVVGATSIATISVTFPAGADNCGTPSATDTSSIIVGPVRLVTTQAKNAACDAAGITTALSGSNLSATALSVKPGECVVYRVVATNEGTSEVKNINLSNVVPSYTTLSATQPTTTCSSTNITPAFSNPSGWTTSTTSVTCGNGATATTMKPGGTATLTFQVKLNN